MLVPLPHNIHSILPITHSFGALVCSVTDISTHASAADLDILESLLSSRFLRDKEDHASRKAWTSPLRRTVQGEGTSLTVVPLQARQPASRVNTHAIPAAVL